MEATYTNTTGQKLEGVAFQFCKVATVALVTGRYALPVASGLCAIFYALAWIRGERSTRCVLRYPLLVAPFWAGVCVGSLFFLLR